MGEAAMPKRMRPGRCALGATAALLLALAFLSAALAAGKGLDRLQVSAREFAAYLLSKNPGARTGHLGAPDEAAVNVSWFEAQDYCLAEGKRLPSVEEWISACRAGDLSSWSQIWEWTRTDAEGAETGGGKGFKILCGPDLACGCSHAYQVTWRNAVKGFRCAAAEPNVRRKPGGRQPPGRTLFSRKSGDFLPASTPSPPASGLSTSNRDPSVRNIRPEIIVSTGSR